MENKSKEIVWLLDRLRKDLSIPFSINDHWEGDLMAVGLTNVDDPQLLVYILIDANDTGCFYAALEYPPEDGSLPYKPGSEFNDLDYEKLVKIIEKHLSGGQL